MTVWNFERWVQGLHELPHMWLRKHGKGLTPHEDGEHQHPLNLRIPRRIERRVLTTHIYLRRFCFQLGTGPRKIGIAPFEMLFFRVAWLETRRAQYSHSFLDVFYRESGKSRIVQTQGNIPFSCSGNPAAS